MFENIGSFFKKIMKNDTKELVSDTTLSNASKEAAKERLQLVLMQDRANVSADFLDLMKQEIIEVIKKYIDIDENAMDVRLTNKENNDGTNGAPALYANIPIMNIKDEVRKTAQVEQNPSTETEKRETKKSKKNVEKTKKEDKPKEEPKEEKNTTQEIEQNAQQSAEQVEETKEESKN